jgi:hypothetical protein
LQPVRRRRTLSVAYLCIVSLFVWRVASFYEPRTGFTSLIGFGDLFEPGALPTLKALPHVVRRHSAGYDGQFYAQLAMDPLLRDPATDRAMDDAPLRARRILFAWTAYLSGWGRPRWILQAYAIQNAVCWLALAALLITWFPPHDARLVSLWGATVLTGGLIWSVRASLLDGPSLLLIAIGMAALERGRAWVAAAIFSVAGLGRETNLLAAASLLAPKPLSWKFVLIRAAQTILVVVPFAIWLDYMYAIYLDRVYTSGQTLAVPFAGFAWKWRSILARVGAGTGWQSRYSVVTLISITAQTLFLLARPRWNDAWWRLGFAYVMLMSVLGQPLWTGEPGTAARVLLPLTLAVNVLLRACDRPASFWPWFAAVNLSTLEGLAMLHIPLLSRWF